MFEGSETIPINSIFEESFGFEKVAIKQKKNICSSRLDADTKSEIMRGIFVDIPLIAANMSTVINSEFLNKIISLGAFGFLHRAIPDDEYIEEVKKVAQRNDLVPVSIGIGKNQEELARKLVKNGANIILIDIAHGYSDEVIRLGRLLKNTYLNDVKVVVGNTTNTDMMEEVYDFADAVKVGIGQGLACTTKNMAGVTEKQFSCVYKFKEISKKLGLPIISDGGVKEPADFVKAIGASANSVMAGSIFASCPESAAPVAEVEGKSKKLYAGMASEYVQDHWKGGIKPGTCHEGEIRYLDIGLSVEKLLEIYRGGLRSGITYAGGNDIPSFQKNVEFIRII